MEGQAPAGLRLAYKTQSDQVDGNNVGGDSAGGTALETEL